MVVVMASSEQHPASLQSGRRSGTKVSLPANPGAESSDDEKTAEESATTGSQSQYSDVEDEELPGEQVQRSTKLSLSCLLVITHDCFCVQVGLILYWTYICEQMQLVCPWIMLAHRIVLLC